MRKFATLCLLITITSTLSAQSDDALDKLAKDFWCWRAKYAPFNGDDVPRMERPGGIRDWSRGAIEKRRKDLGEFESRWKKIDTKGRADSGSGRLPFDRLRIVAGSVGARYQSWLETRSHILHRPNSNRAYRGADGSRALRRNPEPRNSDSNSKHSVDFGAGDGEFGKPAGAIRNRDDPGSWMEFAIVFIKWRSVATVDHLERIRTERRGRSCRRRARKIPSRSSEKVAVAAATDGARSR